MRAPRLAIAAFMIGASSAAFAQTPPPPPLPVASDTFALTQSHWTAAGFVGGSFGANAVDAASVTFGGQIGYLWHGAYGLEAIGDYTHNFKIPSVLLADDPHVLTSMANVIVALPLGTDGEFKPYISGGVGSVAMRADVVGIAANGTAAATGHQTRFGSNVGGGFMGFAGKVGMRGDLRWYKASDDHNASETTPADAFTATLMTGLEFWRASGGVVVRW